MDNNLVTFGPILISSLLDVADIKSSKPYQNHLNRTIIAEVIAVFREKSLWNLKNVTTFFELFVLLDLRFGGVKYLVLNWSNRNSFCGGGN